jgi:hypothetical protein
VTHFPEKILGHFAEDDAQDAAADQQTEYDKQVLNDILGDI